MNHRVLSGCVAASLALISVTIGGCNINGTGLVDLTKQTSTPTATPTPTPSANPTEAPADYFPMAEGAKWLYDVIVNNQKVGTISQTLSLVTTQSGVTTANMRTVTTDLLAGTETIGNHRFTKLPNEVQSTNEAGTISIEIRLPPRVGDSWVNSGTTVSVAAVEDVSTAAQGFREAYKLVATDPDGSRNSLWFAAGTGLVKGQSIRTNGSVMTIELTSYTKP